MIVFCTVPSAEEGKRIATALVKEGLCACVNQLPSVSSYYIYEGEFCENGEELLMIKTLPSHYERLEARIIELHPYDVPEVIATDIKAGSAAYMKWLEGALG
jgi:periplasmic divalent cation tolerance protein